MTKRQIFRLAKIHAKEGCAFCAETVRLAKKRARRSSDDSSRIAQSLALAKTVDEAREAFA